MREDDSDYYGDVATEDREAPEKEREESDEETALLPRSIFPSGKEPKVGKKCKFEVVHVYDDEIEVKYVKHKSKDSDDDDDEGSEPDSDEDDDPFKGMGE